MGLFGNLFGKKKPVPDADEEHAVTVHFSYGIFTADGAVDMQPLFEVQDQLSAAIDAAGAGELDGNEMAVSGSDGFLFMYGPDCDRLFEVIRPVLISVPFMQGAKVTLRYGPPEDGVPEKELLLEQN